MSTANMYSCLYQFKHFSEYTSLWPKQSCYEEGKQVGLQLCNFLVALIVGAVVADAVLIQLIFTVSVSKCS